MLLAAAPSPDRVVYLMAVTTGLRFGELAGLDVGDVDVAERVLHVRRVVIELPDLGQRVKPYPKGGATARRAIGLSATVVQVLTEHLSDRLSDEPLWPNLDGGRQWYSTAFRLLRAAYRRAGSPGPAASTRCAGQPRPWRCSIQRASGTSRRCSATGARS